MRAVFLAAILPKKGPEVIILHPESILSSDEMIELSLKCMPMGSKENDFSSIVFNNFQVAGYLTSTPPIDKKADPRDTMVSIGFLLDIYTNPIPYRDLLIEFVSKCGKSESFNLPTLKKIIPEFFKLKEQRNIQITLSEKLTCELILNNLD